jgi:hypothetical protein
MDVMDKIYILTVGYPLINPMDDEKISEWTLLKDKLGVINPYDYNIMMVKDLSSLQPFPEIFDEVGKYRAILAFSFWSFSDFGKYPPYSFSSSYSKALTPYLLSKDVNGSNIIFRKEHWLGKVFNKYEGYFNYEGGFSPSPQLEEVIRYEELGKDVLTFLNKGLNTKLCEKSYDPFAITPGGLTVGAVVKIGDSTLILHPKPSFEDENLFKNFMREFLNEIKTNLLGVKYPQITKPRWVNELYAEDEKK